jgi:LacI family transcriptional regulator
MFTQKLAVPRILRTHPTVLLNAVPARSMPITCVVPDETEAGRAAARVLLEAGHREGIYLIGAGPRRNQGPPGSLAAVERLQGISEALHAAGVTAAGALASPDWQPEYGQAAVRGLLDAGAVPRALICFNDRVALGAYTALAEAGLSVPSDVSVVSFDDDPIAAWIRPQLTTIAIPHYELGRRSIELLLDGGDGARANGGPQVHRVPMPLRERDSVQRVEPKPG